MTSQETTEATSMMRQQLMSHVPKIILVYPLEGMDMCSCGSAQYMATATDSSL